MSKTIDLQIEKSNALINGLRENLSELADKGLDNSHLDNMSSDLDRLAKASQECDTLRAELSEKVRAVNEILADVKEAFVEKKKIIKNNYPQELWAHYGVMDKR